MKTDKIWQQKAEKKSKNRLITIVDAFKQ